MHESESCGSERVAMALGIHARLVIGVRWVMTVSYGSSPAPRKALPAVCHLPLLQPGRPSLVRTSRHDPTPILNRLGPSSRHSSRRPSSSDRRAARPRLYTTTPPSAPSPSSTPPASRHPRCPPSHSSPPASRTPSARHFHRASHRWRRTPAPPTQSRTRRAPASP